MKTAALMLLSVILCGIARSADVRDVCIDFSTQGPDRYSDGSVVLDGECYALVWSADGNFEGFTAAGECVDTNDCVVIIAPVAKDGRCPKTLFQIPIEQAKALKGGRYSVYLLDTRVAAAEGASKRRGTTAKPKLVNGYGAVTSAVSISSADSSTDSMPESTTEAGGQIASSLSAAPKNTVQPKVKGLRVENGTAYLTVENLKGFMRVQSGKSAGHFESTGAATETSGESADITLTAPAEGSSGFYKIIRN